MSNEEFTELQDELTTALEKVLAKYEKSQIIKWVALVEVIGLEDGERGLWSLANKSAKAWDIKGLLLHALDIEKARVAKEYFDGDE